MPVDPQAVVRLHDAGKSKRAIARLLGQSDDRTIRRIIAEYRPKAAPPELAKKVLVLDIETFPLEAYVWGLHDQNVGLEQIKQEATIACFAAKWLGEDRVYFESVGGRGAGKIRDDSVLLPTLWQLLHQAQFVVAQNGIAFDVPWINSRLVVAGYKPYSPLRVLDTLRMAQRCCRFTSNKQAWLTRHLAPAFEKSEHQNYPGFKLWSACLADDPKAWKEMREYNVIDVLGCEQVYHVLRPWDTRHPNVATYQWGHTTACPTCGSANIQADGYKTLTASAYVQYVCKDCGAWSRGKEMQIEASARQEKLVK